MATVLVVDDDPGIGTYLSALIEGWGHRVIVAADADAALGWLELGHIEVAFCDIVMPGYSGIWLVEQIVARHPETAIIIATGLDALDPRVTLQSGVVGYITKPFEVDQVAAMIGRALRMRKSRTALRPASASEGV